MNRSQANIIACLITALIWLFVLVSNVHCMDHCHPGQHTCQTDRECADEEAYFLDMDELHQSDDEEIDLSNMSYDTIAKEIK